MATESAWIGLQEGSDQQMGGISHHHTPHHHNSSHRMINEAWEYFWSKAKELNSLDCF